ncbi:proclotting enzyme precursor, putative [Ixodes scapularis]|uniref:limulus clotting factor C n=1 Tax=Ixodes scapularis TaxID=6945 RepID=B7Q613_IXOSC|nr:proclotting enzyme precursor, putative [Ixodes scapularis]|eukprot:XP_002411861.1 proclotting enzyme precursor, putative [Ixodes scapularis]
MTARFNSAWRLILRLLLVVVCVQLCSCQKVAHTSNLEGNQAALPLPRSGDPVPKGTEQETANRPDGVGDVIEDKEPPTTTSTRSRGDALSGSSIVVPVVVSGNDNGETKNNIDTPSQDNHKPNQAPERPELGSATGHVDEGPLQNIENEKPGPGTHDPLANVNVTEFIEQNCGKAHSRKRRIVGGTISSVTTYPWTVGIFMVGSSKPYCGAVLITPWFVLTAAHCTRGRPEADLRVAYGLQTINERTLEERQEHVAVVTKIHQHERFVDIVHGDDISMLQLKTPLLADGQLVPPICTPQVSQLDRSSVVNTMGVVAGWGRTTYNGESSSDLREVSLPIVSNKRCSEVFKDVVEITDGMICAGDITGKKDACQGDSGGPLMWYSSVFERWYVIGVVSFGVKCAEKGYYGTYTWVEKYLGWICKITNGLVCLQTTGGQQKQPTSKPEPGTKEPEPDETTKNSTDTQEGATSTTTSNKEPPPTATEEAKHNTVLTTSLY